MSKLTDAFKKNPDKIVKNNRTLLQQAIYNESPHEVVKRLNAGADINLLSDNGYTALTYAAYCTFNFETKRKEIIDILLDNPDIIVDKPTGRKRTALWLSYKETGDSPLFSKLIKAGANPLLSPEGEGASILLRTLYDRELSFLKNIFISTTDPEKKNLYIAHIEENLNWGQFHPSQDKKIFNFLSDTLEISPPSSFYLKSIWSSINDENIRDIRKILENVSYEDLRNKDQRTPLHMAAIKNNHRIIINLLEAGADPNALDADRFTPLDLMAEHGFIGQNNISERFLKEAGGTFHRLEPKDNIKNKTTPQPIKPSAPGKN